MLITCMVAWFSDKQWKMIKFQLFWYPCPMVFFEFSPFSIYFKVQSSGTTYWKQYEKIKDVKIQNIHHSKMMCASSTAHQIAIPCADHCLEVWKNYLEFDHPYFLPSWPWREFHDHCTHHGLHYCYCLSKQNVLLVNMHKCTIFYTQLWHLCTLIYHNSGRWCSDQHKFSNTE